MTFSKPNRTPGSLQLELIPNPENRLLSSAESDEPYYEASPELEPSPEPYAPLDLSSVRPASASVYGPLSSVIEFDPDCYSDHSALLSILDVEMAAKPSASWWAPSPRSWSPYLKKQEYDPLHLDIYAVFPDLDREFSIG